MTLPQKILKSCLKCCSCGRAVQVLSFYYGETPDDPRLRVHTTRGAGAAMEWNFWVWSMFTCRCVDRPVNLRGHATCYRQTLSKGTTARLDIFAFGAWGLSTTENWVRVLTTFRYLVEQAEHVKIATWNHSIMPLWLAVKGQGVAGQELSCNVGFFWRLSQPGLITWTASALALNIAWIFISTVLYALSVNLHRTIHCSATRFGLDFFLKSSIEVRVRPAVDSLV